MVVDYIHHIKALVIRVFDELLSVLSGISAEKVYSKCYFSIRGVFSSPFVNVQLSRVAFWDWWSLFTTV